MKRLQIDTLPKGYADPIDVLLYASFQILVDFVEKEHALESHVDWNGDEDHRHAAQEIKDLYHWWKEVRPTRDVEYWKNPKSILDQWWAEDQANLRRLVDIRGCLWT